MERVDLTLNVNGPAAAVEALIATMVAKATSSAPAPAVFSTLRTSMMPRIGEPWPDMPGSAYAGIARGEDGQPDWHLVLLPDKPSADLDWEAAKAWAAGLGDGASLPTRFESALLYANLQSHFEKDRWHWTSSQYSAAFAWGQGFINGNQDDNDKSYEARARAVRRFAA